MKDRNGTEIKPGDTVIIIGAGADYNFFTGKVIAPFPPADILVQFKPDFHLGTEPFVFSPSEVEKRG